MVHGHHAMGALADLFNIRMLGELFSQMVMEIHKRPLVLLDIGQNFR